MRKHIAFFIFARHPCVGPTLPIVSVLTRRGYRVTYATTPHFASRVRAAGADVTVCEFDSVGDDADTETDGLTRWIKRKVGMSSQIYEHDLPDLIIYSTWGIDGYVLARRHSIPSIYADTGYAFDRRSLETQIPHKDQRQDVLRGSAWVDHALSNLGICNTDWFFTRELLNIFFCPKTFQPCAEMMDECCFFAGRCAGEQPHYGKWARPDARDRPIVLVATSTNIVQGPSYFRTWIDAFKGLPYYVLLSIGDRANPCELGTLPPNFEVVQHVSHVTILPHVALYAGNGGIISSAEAAYHGVPMILTSLGNPELEWEADILNRLGHVVHVTKNDFQLESLRRAVRRAEEVGTLNRALAIRHLVRREPGAEDAVNRIEEILNW